MKEDDWPLKVVKGFSMSETSTLTIVPLEEE